MIISDPGDEIQYVETPKRKIIIAGSRTFQDYNFLKKSVDMIIEKYYPKSNITIVSGRARGADRLGEAYAVERRYKTKLFPADWEQYGKSAGYRRNKEMGDYANVLIAFWDGKSKGTEHMIDYARAQILDTHVFRVDC